jgi:SAM-dependent methyltransferase
LTDNATITLADTGLGTTYERWALNRVLLRLFGQGIIESALEGPGDGMTGIAGINSIVLGRQGVHVTLCIGDRSQAAYAERVWRFHVPDLPAVIVTDPGFDFPDEAYDLVWNFNVLAGVPDPGALLSEMARVSRHYVFFCVPNANNYAFWLHRLHHRVAGQPWDHGDVCWMRMAPWLDLLPEKGLRLREAFYLDCPWWPDIVDLGQLIADFLPFLKGLARKAAPENRLKWEPEALPYYELVRHPDLDRRMARLGFIEDSGVLRLKRLFGHHLGILAEKL